jgi:hypothetical protein
MLLPVHDEIFATVAARDGAAATAALVGCTGTVAGRPGEWAGEVIPPQELAALLVRVELATATTQLDAERAAHQREQQAATELLNDIRAQGRHDAEQRVNELRSTYETWLANEQARHTSEMEQLRHQLTEAAVTTQTTTRRRRGGKEDDQ